MAHDGKDALNIEDIKRSFEEGGIMTLTSFVDRKMNEWKNVPINIAFIGNTGTGKSSFINAMLGLTAEDEGAAEVGVTETTKELTPYRLPINPQLVMWDMPGLGTPTYNRGNYFDLIQVDCFDYFIFVTCDRFRDDDLWLAKELDEKRKPIYFIRSKVGQDMANDKKSHPKTHTDKKMLDKIRNDCEQSIRSIELYKELTVYLIDSFEPEKYDFDLFFSKLIEDAPDLKVEAIVLSMTVLTQSVILSKKKVLSDRILWKSLISAVAGAIPMPLLDSAIDKTLLESEARFYSTQFGISDKQLGACAELSGESIEQLVCLLSLKSRIPTKDLLAYLTETLTKTAILAGVKMEKYLLPILGSAICGTVSYGLMYRCLHETLGITAEDAIKIYNHKMKICS